MIRNRNGGHDYHLYIYTLGTNNNNFLIDNLYLNEDNKGTRPNSTSYVWHPGGDYIFYITTDAKRNVAYIDLKNLKHPKVKILETGIEFAEQISISPNGKYLAVMTQIASEEDKGALGQLYLVELSY
jgi:Tol biopolymer transport system component